MGQIFKRVLELRDEFGTRRRIVIQKLDVKTAFWQVGVDPAKASNSGTGGGDIVHLLAAAVRVQGEPRVVGSDRQRDPGGTATDHKGRISVRYVSKNRRGLGKGGVGVARGTGGFWS